MVETAKTGQVKSGQLSSASDKITVQSQKLEAYKAELEAMQDHDALAPYTVVKLFDRAAKELGAGPEGHGYRSALEAMYQARLARSDLGHVKNPYIDPAREELKKSTYVPRSDVTKLLQQAAALRAEDAVSPGSAEGIPVDAILYNANFGDNKITDPGQRAELREALRSRYAANWGGHVSAAFERKLAALPDAINALDEQQRQDLLALQPKKTALGEAISAAAPAKTEKAQGGTWGLLKPAAKPELEEVSAADFDAKVTRAGKPVLVFFKADWAGTSKMQEAVLADLPADLTAKVKLAQMSIDDNTDFLPRYGISGVPTLILFQGDKMVAGFQGIEGAKPLTEAVTRELRALEKSR